MLNWILSSSVLILGIIFIRALFQKRMKSKVQYALWLLVLVRLLIPFNVGHSSMSVSNVSHAVIMPEPVAQTQQVQLPQKDLPLDLPEREPMQVPGDRAEKSTPAAKAPQVQTRSVWEILSKVLAEIWIAGAAIMGLIFLSTNITFRRRLKVTRHRLSVQECKLPVYVTNRIKSPCLFGILHPAVYVTRQVAQDETMLRHTVAHELTHYSHGDHVWAILRGVCLTIHWYNPLVWCAGLLSQRDAELACDEDTIRALGEAERVEYGKTLIQVTCQKSSHLLTAATTMTSDKKVLKQRIKAIAGKRRNVAAAVIAAVLIAAVFVGCTFTGAKVSQNEEKEAEKYTIETTLSSAETPLPTGKTIREDVLLNEILSGTGSFYSLDLKRNVTFGEFCSTLLEGYMLTAERYALVDLDRDGTEEAVFELYITEDNNMGTLILHQSGEQHMGYLCSYRQMNNIKEDGTFSWSGGAAHNGFARVTGFSPEEILYENTTWVDDTEGPTYFYVNGEKAEESQYRASVEKEDSKPGLNWVEISHMPTETKNQSHGAMQKEIAAILKAAEDRELELKEKEQTALTQADMNGISQLQYEEWDKVLNTIWAILKDTLSEEEMEKLTQEQIAWIKEKEAAAEQAVVNAGASSMAISAYSRTAKEWTIHRLEILIPMITGEQISLQSEGAPSFLGGSWQEAYRKILISDPIDYLGNADGNRSDNELTNQAERWIYLGIHDFDGDGIPELIIGDDYSLAVFAYYYGSAEKIADLYYPGSNWCVNGVNFKGNSLNVQCNGAGVSTFVNFGFLNGRYLLGLYDEMSGSDVIINGKISTLEEMNRIYPTDFEQITPEEYKEKTKMTWENEKWVLHFASGEKVEITENFDFSRTLWN